MFIFNRFGEADHLPVLVKDKLEALPVVMSRLESTQTATIAKITSTH